MILTHLKLTNFRGFEDLSLKLEPDLTVFVGGNGSGKSSVLYAIRVAASHAIHDAFNNPVRTGDYTISLKPADLRNGSEKASIFASWAEPGCEQELYYRLTSDGGVEPSGPRVDSGGSPPLLIYLGADRARIQMDSARSGGSARLSVRGKRPAWDENRAGDGFLAFEHLKMWFREKEDFENQEKVRGVGREYVDRDLEAVRSLVSEVLGSDYGGLRGERGNGPLSFRLVLSKGDQELTEDQLSDGERSLLSMAATIARRLCLLDLNDEQPLHQPALVLIDEVELHLHGKWQRELLPRLRKTFPNVQFIVTTHSPTVLSTLPGDKLRILKNFDVCDFTEPVYGRDANSLLEDVFRVSERPDEVQAMIDEISELMDDPNSVTEVRTKLSELIGVVGPHDPEVVRIQVLLDFLTRDLGDDSGDE